MNRKLTVYAALFAVFWIVAPPAAARVIHLATIEEFRPFIWQENNRATGINADTIREMARRAGIRIKITHAPWNRVMAMTKAGKVHGAFAAFKTKERESFAFFLEYPLHLSTYTLFIRSGDRFIFSSIKDLYGKSIGNNSGFSLGEEFDTAKKENKIRVQEAETIEQNLEKLIRGRFSAYIGNFHATSYLIKTMGWQNSISHLKRPVRRPTEAYLIFSKAAEMADKQDVIRRCNNALKAMQEDGTSSRIHSAYLN